MILTGNQIRMARENGWLDISDWKESRLNPNSYNLRLADELMVYAEPILLPEDGIPQDVYDRLMAEGKLPALYGPNMELDMKKQHMTKRIHIPETGYLLRPGILYLGRTMEYTETHKFVPMLEGRSSGGRLGISIHSTAGFGDIGFCGYWTLEISCVQPTWIYPNVEICQIYYHTVGCLRDCDGFLESGYWHGDIFIPHDNPSLMKYDNKGKYQKNTGIQPSMMWKELQNENLPAT